MSDAQRQMANDQGYVADKPHFPAEKKNKGGNDGSSMTKWVGGLRHTGGGDVGT